MFKLGDEVITKVNGKRNFIVGAALDGSWYDLFYEIPIKKTAGQLRKSGEFKVSDGVDDNFVIQIGTKTRVSPDEIEEVK